MYDCLLFFGLALWIGCVAWFVRRPCASVFHPAAHYLLVHGVLFALRPVLAWWLVYDTLYGVIGFRPNMAEKITVLLCADLSLVVFLAVSTRVGNLPMIRSSPSERGLPPAFDLGFWTAIVLCAPPAIVSLLQNVQAHTVGVTTQILDMDTGMVMNTDQNGYFTDLQLMLWSLTALIAWAARFRWWSLCPLALFIVFKAATGGRYPIVVAVIATGLFFLYESRRLWPQMRLLVLAIPLLVLFTVLGEDRGQRVRQLILGAPESKEVQYFQLRPLESMDYANLEFMEYIVHTVPKESGAYDLFTSNSRILVEPIPRVMWPGKPHGALFSRVKLWRYGVSVGATNSVPGQGWLDAGWAGVVIWTALFAALFGKVYNSFVASRQTRFQVALFMLFTATCIQSFRDGVLLTVVKVSFFPLVPVWIWLIASALFSVERRRRRSSEAAVLEPN